LRWRLHPIETGSLLHLTLSYQLNGAASLRQRHWHERLQAHCLRMLQFVATDLERVTPETEIEVYGARSQEKT
jgi:hypothetical protein